MTNTINLSRYTFLKPKIAAFLLILTYLHDRFYDPIFSYLQTLGIFDIPQSPWIFSFFFFLYFGIGVLISLYNWGVLWKILHQHFDYRGSDRWFQWMILFYLLDVGLESILGVSGMNLEWAKWPFYLPEIICTLLLMISILRMPGDLFRMKWWYGLATIVSTIYGLVLRISFSAIEYPSGDTFILSLMAKKTLLFLAGIFLFVIFWRAHKHSLPPKEDPILSKIEEMGEENL